MRQRVERRRQLGGRRCPGCHELCGGDVSPPAVWSAPVSAQSRGSCNLPHSLLSSGDPTWPAGESAAGQPAGGGGEGHPEYRCGALGDRPAGKGWRTGCSGAGTCRSAGEQANLAWGRDKRPGGRERSPCEPLPAWLRAALNGGDRAQRLLPTATLAVGTQFSEVLRGHLS